MKTCVLIPAHNEESKIGEVVSNLISKGLSVFVIDDGSTDSTASRAGEKGALILGRLRNMGKGAALRKGFNYILRRTDFDGVITMDGDGQHSVRDIGKFLDLGSKGSDFVVGNRLDRPRNMPLVRFLTNHFMSLVLSFISGQHVPDTQCGYRYLSRNVLGSLRLRSSRFDTESEMLVEAARKKFRIESVPIETIYTGHASQINPASDTIRFILLLWRLFFIRAYDK